MDLTAKNVRHELLLKTTITNFVKKLAVKFLEMLGANFKRQFDAETYEKFFAGMGYEKTGYEIVSGRMSCDVAVIEVRKN